MNDTDKKIVKVNKDAKFMDGVAVEGSDKKYDVEIVGGDQAETTFERLEEGSKSTNKIKIKIKEDGTSDWKDGETEIEYHENFWRKGFTLPKKLKSSDGSIDITLKNADKRLSTNYHTFTLKTYGVVAAVVIALGAFIWYWVASSKSEEKEEEESL